MVWVNIRDLRWCQTDCGGPLKTPRLVREFAAAGGKWLPEKGTIDVVATSDGLVTLDHTRLRVAERFGIERVTARVHSPGDPLPAQPYPNYMDAKRRRSFERAANSAEMARPRTWGDLIAIRSKLNGLGPTGTTQPPDLLGAD